MLVVTSARTMEKHISYTLTTPKPPPVVRNITKHPSWQPATIVQQQDMLANITHEHAHLVRKLLTQKQQGYLSQDKRHGFSTTGLLTIQHICDKLRDADMRCIYCGTSVSLLYTNRHDSTQWTLDRIDNTQPHTCANCVIACLACNLKRRTQRARAFLDSTHLLKHTTVIKKTQQEPPVAIAET